MPGWPPTAGAIPPALGHVGYVVTNADAAAQECLRLLGLSDLMVYDFSPLHAWVDGRELPECRLRIAVGAMGNGVKVELVQPVAGDTPHARFLREKGPGPHHVAFYTKQFDEWLSFYRKLGAAIVFQAEVEDELIGYRRSFYAQTPEMPGLIEISEVPRRR